MLGSLLRQVMPIKRAKEGNMKNKAIIFFAISELILHSEALAEEVPESVIRYDNQSHINYTPYNIYQFSDQNYYAPYSYEENYYPQEQEPISSYRDNKRSAKSERTGMSYYYQ